ncbi:PqqD family protein [Kribbella solani]|uniref:PqqD family protein n=1 Tax=Kribbella solani TaxID=236067 RepID=UPI0029A7430F|nr:PqqD family protein [Kribbella solani]MDX2970018.1 PqqD family protein [Kribbella solani]MDX3001898.1 PqqD family protein [Kribbella solani]
MAMVELERTPLDDVTRSRDQAFAGLRAAMPLAEALRCAVRLEAELQYREELERNLVMVAYGGGKDSSYTLAFVRAMQLILYRVHGRTFRMRVATNRHAGMPRAVMENIDREYQALRLYDDPDCELLLVDGDEVSEFFVDSPQREQVIRRNRLDILMTGHRTFADGRPTFCNSCNLSVFNAFGVAASSGTGADLIITGDSPREQRQYTAWVGRLARQIRATGNNPAKQHASTGNGFGTVLGQLDDIAGAYFTDILGPDASSAIAERQVRTDVPRRLRFFSIYDETDYAAGDHFELLTGFLGFQFDELAFSFTESDCANPALMAHLRGLKAERLFQRSYDEGMTEYVEFALGLMRKKDIPAGLIEMMRARYDSPDALRRMRKLAAEYALETFALTESHLVCMTYSPFIGQGAGLEQFLEREHPDLAGRLTEIRDLLAGVTADQELAARLEDLSGLECERLQVLYGRPTQGPVIDLILRGDPHKAVIETKHTQNGPNTFEQISGR